MRPSPSLLRLLASAALQEGSALLSRLAAWVKEGDAAARPAEGKDAGPAVRFEGDVVVTPAAAELLARPKSRPEVAAPPAPLPGSLRARRAAGELR